MPCFLLLYLLGSYEDINVKISEGTVKLGEIATVDVKSANMYVIDLISSPDYVKPVFDAILHSKLNSNASVEKTTICLPIPKITREHRENLSKSVKAKSELAIKKIRDIESKALRKAKENKKASKDLIFNVQQQVNYFIQIIFFKSVINVQIKFYNKY